MPFPYDLWISYFKKDEFNVRYGNKKFIKLLNGYLRATEIKYDNTLNTYNVKYYDTEVESNVGLERIKRIFDFKENIRSQDEKMYSVAEFAVYNCAITVTNVGGNFKNTKTYKKKYMKYRIKKTRNQKMIKNKNKNKNKHISNNKKLIKKNTNTLRKK